MGPCERPSPSAERIAALGDIDPLHARLFAMRGLTSAAQLDYGLGRLAPVGSLENIDEALKSANWVGVLEVAKEMSREEDTDATDSDEEQQVTDCGINAEQLGEINDSIVAVGSLIDEGEFAPADEEAPVPASVDAPAMDDEEEVF